MKVTSDLLRGFGALGLTVEQVAGVVCLLEAEDGIRREKERDKKRRQRGMSPDVPGTQGDIEGHEGDKQGPLPPKEIPPTPPKEITPYPVRSDAGANEPLSRLEFGSAFWPEWPNRVGQRAAIESFIAARRKASLDAIMDGVRRYKATKPPDRQWMNPSTFLDEERWTDEPAPASQPAKERPHDAIFRALARHAEAGRGDDERPADAPLRVLDQRGAAA